MNKISLILCFWLYSLNIEASILIDDKRIKKQKSCFSWVYSDFASWRNSMEIKFSKRLKSEDKIEQALIRFDSLFNKEKFNYYQSRLSCSTFTYFVNNQPVKGFVIKPSSNKEKLPVLIYNRGGNGKFGAVVFGSMMHNLFPIADEGFVILGSQYRGTFTKNSLIEDEFGGGDVKGVTTLLDYIANVNGADVNRLGMFGASRGGMQTHLATKQSSNIKAIATIAGNSDLLKGLTYRPEMEKVYKRLIPDYDKNKVSELEKRSVLKWVDKLSSKIPILLLHGTNDKRVSVKHSIDLADALQKNNIEHKLVLYPEDNHGLTHNKDKANQEIVSWFLEHL